MDSSHSMLKILAKKAILGVQNFATTNKRAKTKRSQNSIKIFYSFLGFIIFMNLKQFNSKLESYSYVILRPQIGLLIITWSFYILFLFLRLKIEIQKNHVTFKIFDCLSCPRFLMSRDRLQFFSYFLIRNTLFKLWN